MAIPKTYTKGKIVFQGKLFEAWVDTAEYKYCRGKQAWWPIFNKETVLHILDVAGLVYNVSGNDISYTKANGRVEKLDVVRRDVYYKFDCLGWSFLYPEEEV